MMLLVALLTLASCETRQLTLKQAKELVLAAPEIQAAVKQRGAKPFFDGVDTGPRGWRFDVNSATPCLHPRNSCSTLLGHFAVSRDGDVEDLDAARGAGTVISSLEIRRRALRFRTENCAWARQRK